MSLDFTSPQATKAQNADKLDGHDSTHFATQESVDDNTEVLVEITQDVEDLKNKEDDSLPEQATH